MCDMASEGFWSLVTAGNVLGRRPWSFLLWSACTHACWVGAAGGCSRTFPAGGGCDSIRRDAAVPTAVSTLPVESCF